MPQQQLHVVLYWPPRSKPPHAVSVTATVLKPDLKNYQNRETRHTIFFVVSRHSCGVFAGAHPPRGRGSVYLEVSRGGAVLPAAHGLDDGGAAQWTSSLPVEPQAQALLTEHVLHKQHHVSLLKSAVNTLAKKKIDWKIKKPFRISVYVCPYESFSITEYTKKNLKKFYIFGFIFI